MKDWRHWFWNMIILFLCVCILAGCKDVPKTKTILIPEEEIEQGVALQGEKGDRYAVRKIYSKDYDTPIYWGFSAFLPGAGEHQVRLAENDIDGLGVQTLDYRYGFYGSEAFPDARLPEGFGLKPDGDGVDGQNLDADFFSPDGRYLLYLRQDMSPTDMRLYLMDLETGEEVLLLDGDAYGCPGNRFMVLSAWSRDASLLCYGFFPRSVEAWNSCKDDLLTLHYRDMEMGEEVGSLNYFNIDTIDEAQNLQETQIYVDRDGNNILTAIVSEQEDGENTSSDQVYVTLVLQNVQDPEQEAECVKTFYANGYSKDAKMYPDARGRVIYFTSLDEGIIRYHLDEDASASIVPMKKNLAVQDFCVLDEGKAFVTAEYDGGNMEGMLSQNICLYTATGGKMARRVLYQDAGHIVRFQYDPVYRRILAEIDKPSDAEGINSDSYIQKFGNRRALMLEF